MKPIDWLLAHLDEPGVLEVVLGVGRPAAVRADEGFRPVTSMSFERNDIETLVAGTPMSGLIGSPTSLPPTEMQIDARRLVVEVIRQGANAAIRIALAEPAAPPPRARGATTAPARSPSTTTPPRTATTTTPPRTAGKSSPPQTVPADDAPLVSVRMTSPSTPPRTTTTTTPPRTAATSSPPPTAPADDVPLVSVRMTSPSTPPRNLTTTVPPSVAPRSIAATTPPLTVTPLSTTTMPRIATEHVPPPEPAPAPEHLPEPHAHPHEAGGEIDDVEGEAAAPEYGAPDDSGTADGTAEAYGTGWYGPQIIDERADISAVHALLEAAYRRGASDLHVIAKQRLTIRRLGQLTPLDVNALSQPFDTALYTALMGPLEPTLAERFLLPLLGPTARQRVSEVGYVDFGFQVPGLGRARANISQQQDGLAGTFRLCRDKVPTLDSLGLPRELEKTVRHHQGLVVIAGPSGHGKTTTMAALVDLLNTANSDHIITIEDPVEIEHPAKRAIVSHREVGRHTLSFVSALKASLREDPDVIVIGELRDRESVEIALAAAETGHLVLATISTPSAVKTIDRLIDMFPPDDQVQVRASISGTLRAVIAQRLLPNATEDGMVAAIELVTGVLPLATMIRENKLFQLPSLMQRGRAFGMIRLDDSLADHVRAKRITEEVALAAAQNKRDLAALLAGRPAPAPTNVRGLFGGKGPS